MCTFDGYLTLVPSCFAVSRSRDAQPRNQFTRQLCRIVTVTSAATVSSARSPSTRIGSSSKSPRYPDTICHRLYVLSEVYHYRARLSPTETYRERPNDVNPCTTYTSIINGLTEGSIVECSRDDRTGFEGFRLYESYSPFSPDRL